MIIGKGEKLITATRTLLNKQNKIDCKIIRNACLNKLFNGKMKKYCLKKLRRSQESPATASFFNHKLPNSSYWKHLNMISLAGFKHFLNEKLPRPSYPPSNFTTRSLAKIRPQCGNHPFSVQL